MHTDSIKFALAAAAAALMTYFSQILVPVMVLCFVMLLDYCTGVHAAWVHRELNSRTGILGILKKMSYLALVAVACVIDYVLATVGSGLGLVITVQFVALLVVFWLIINELISILENIDKVGGPVPPFVEKLLWRLKGSVEDSAPDVSDANLPEEYKGKHEKRTDDQDGDGQNG
jgi:toxin secretion/phage lysis holin